MTKKPYDYFIILAEMRTGSNLLEEILNSFDGVICHGEAFNPSFVGHKNTPTLLGMDIAQREADPLELIRRMKEDASALPSFRFFHDHDPRVLAHCLTDQRCAKVVLTRNPLESYVSLQIAAQTGQWKLGDLKNQKASSKVAFDAAAFEKHLEIVQGFQMLVMHSLQATGQTAFYLDYEDLLDIEVLNGLAAFLQVEARIEAIPKTLKKQNPDELTQKVTNPQEMETVLARLDRFNLSRTPSFEPRRGPGIPGFIAAANAPLLYMPIKSGPEGVVADWLASVGKGLVQDFSQKGLRQWKRASPGYRSFTVLRHPLARAHHTFCELIVDGRYPEVRQSLRRLYKVRLPNDSSDPAYDIGAHRAAFLGFLRFLKGNLAGQTSIRVDAAWASQSAVLQGYSIIAAPDFVFREDSLTESLTFLAGQVGAIAPEVAVSTSDARYTLAEVVTEEIETAAREAYLRDYIGFGFGAWNDSAP